jgi:LPS sulfotransferase NodH
MVRFVIVGHGRSGSALLQVALDRHPEIRCRGELFHNDRAYRESAAGRVYENGESVSDFLWRAAYCADQTTGAVGFKLFFYHARADPAASALWDELRADRELRVILLQRRNLFDCLVSHEKSRRAGQWRLADDDELSPTYDLPIYIDPGWCERFYEQTLAGMEMMRRHFSDQSVLEVCYEELVTDFGSVLARCQEYLGQQPIPVQPPLRKMNNLPHEAGVENYEQLRRHFAQSIYASFIR